jgi:YHS domain-containing protein
MAEKEKTICTVDPVCNMDLESHHGEFMYDFEDVTYYFCSELCKNEFVRQPKNFVKKEES